MRALALLIGFIGNFTYALPVPRMKAEELNDPQWRARALRKISDQLAAFGIHYGEDELRDPLRTLTWRRRQFVLALRRPFKPFFRSIDATQNWGLFASVTERPDQLVVDAIVGEASWSRVYGRLDPEHRWRDEVFRYRRIRGIWDSVRSKPKGTYVRLANWTARELMTERPEVDRVRFYLLRMRLVRPWQADPGEYERRAVRTYSRSRLLGTESDPDEEIE